MEQNEDGVEQRSISQATFISICSVEHIDVWKLTSSLLPVCTNASEYIVYVPRQERDRFLRVTPDCIQVRDQELLCGNYRKSIENKVSLGHNSKRLGWYLQQFMKIEAMITSNQPNLVIWDADCVPTRKISLFDKQGKPLYMEGRERNELYFTNIKNLLGLERIQDFSFVIPGFPMKRVWLVEFLQFLEAKHHKPWYEAIQDSIDFSLTSGFSETETLGTWVANKYPGDWRNVKLTWERSGQSRFGYARSFKPSDIESIGKSNNIDIISFENWDLRGFPLKIKQFHLKVEKLLSQTKAIINGTT